MKSLKIQFVLLALTATTMMVSFRYTFQQAKPMAVFTAPASAEALKNPVKGDAAATALGATLYKKQCSMCHGDKGKGDGAAAASLAKAPANHTSPAVQKLSDGALYWMITNGNNPMPSYKSMTETQRWQLVNFIRTLAKK